MLAPFVERVVTHSLAGLRYLVETSQDAALKEMYAMVKNVPKGSTVIGNELQVLIGIELAGALSDCREGVNGSGSYATEGDVALPAPPGSAAACRPTAATEDALARDLRQMSALSTIFSRFVHLVESHFANDKQIHQGIAMTLARKHEVDVRDSPTIVVFTIIKRYRDGEAVPIEVILNAVKMISKISVMTLRQRDSASGGCVGDPDCNDDLLDKYVVETGKYYARAAEDQLNSPTRAQGFIEWCGSRLRLEEQLVQRLPTNVFWQQVKEKSLSRCLRRLLSES